MDTLALRRVSDARPQLGVVASTTDQIEFAADSAEDLEVLAEAGVTCLHLEFDWARLQPAPGRLDGQTVEWYARVLDQASELGIEVWARLHERSEPRWFQDAGGFGDDRAAATWWPRWVEAAAETFGDQLTGFVPISDPVGWAGQWEPDPKRHAESLLHLTIAWRDAWRILRGSTLVATNLRLRMGRLAGNSVPELEAARREDLLRWRLWLRSLRDGNFILPGRFDRHIGDLAGSVDVLGLTVSTDIRRALDDDELLRWRERIGTILRRVGEEGPDRPLALGLRLGWPHASERSLIHQAARVAVDEAIADRVPLSTVIIDPAIDADDDGRHGGLLGRDRGLLPTTEVWSTLRR